MRFLIDIVRWGGGTYSGGGDACLGGGDGSGKYGWIGTEASLGLGGCSRTGTCSRDGDRLEDVACIGCSTGLTGDGGPFMIPFIRSQSMKKGAVLELEHGEGAKIQTWVRIVESK